MFRFKIYHGCFIASALSFIGATLSVVGLVLVIDGVMHKGWNSILIGAVLYALSVGAQYLAGKLGAKAEQKKADANQEGQSNVGSGSTEE